MLKKKLFLIDGTSLIYRNFFALHKASLINTQNINTGPIRGFTNSIFSMIDQFQPNHLLVVFDEGGPTFRHKLYKPYKQNRSGQPEDITIAKQYIKKILEAMNIQTYSQKGYEADDLIGSVNTIACKKGFHVYIITLDKDFQQLVSPQTFIYQPAFAKKRAEILDIEKVREKWGIDTPAKVKDILALQGDSSDNIPGVQGIGPKIATKLIQQFKSVENILENIDQLDGKLQKNIRKQTEEIKLFKQLVTIETQLHLDISITNTTWKAPDNTVLIEILKELELYSLVKRLSNKPKIHQNEINLESIDPSENSEEEFQIQKDLITLPRKLENITTTPHSYHLVDSNEKWHQFLEQLLKQKEFCFDTETTSLNPFEAELVGISFAFKPHEAYYLPLPLENKPIQETLSDLAQLFYNFNVLKIGHNLKYDISVLQKYGIEVVYPIFDTMLANYVLASHQRHNMKAMSIKYLNYDPIDITTLIGEKKGEQKNMKEIPIHQVAKYAAEDADITLQLKNHLSKLFKEEDKLQKLFYEVEMPLLPVIIHMEKHGLKIDLNELANIKELIQKEMMDITNTIYKRVDKEFNLDSPKQLGKILFEDLKIPHTYGKTQTGQYETSEKILMQLVPKYQIAKEILYYRNLKKIQSSYIEKILTLMNKKTRYLYPNFNQAITVTGRLSATNPNIQSIPIRTEKGRLLRKIFIKRDKKNRMLSADYSQIELRILASFSQDESMLTAFRMQKDIHSTTASKLFQVPLEEITEDMRRKAKTVNFGIIYGISNYGLAQKLNITQKAAKEFIENYFKQFPGIQNYIDTTLEKARTLGYVTTLLGRRRMLRDINSRNINLRKMEERNAINMPIQGTAADMIKIAMIKIYRWQKSVKSKTCMIMQIHDELVFDVPSYEIDVLQEQVEQSMQNALILNHVPIQVTIKLGNNWLDMHPIQKSTDLNH